MPKLFDAEYTHDELRRMISDPAQLAGVRLYELSDGRARGVRAAEVYTGSGFRFQVLLDRAMDVGFAEHSGRPLAWLHPALGGPGLYDPYGYGWLRTFGGGLVTTCGLTFFGQPEQDGAEQLGLHGRISHSPAECVRVTTEQRGDEYVLEVEGVVRQAALFGENLSLTRRISTRLGADSLLIEDVVRNEGFRPTPHMILYHCNLGFPVVAPGAELLVEGEWVRPRDAAAEAGLSEHARFGSPVAGYAEQVFFHKPKPDADGLVRAAIVNRALGFGAYVEYREAELPCLAQWKMQGEGEYVCALEPANQWETPRARLGEEGRLAHLAPGEEVRYYVEIGALPDTAAIQRFESRSPLRT